MVVAGERVVLGRGDTIAIDPREIHLMTNRGSEDVEYVVVGITGNKGGKNGCGVAYSPVRGMLYFKGRMRSEHDFRFYLRVSTRLLILFVQVLGISCRASNRFAEISRHFAPTGNVATPDFLGLCLLPGHSCSLFGRDWHAVCILPQPMDDKT